MKTEAEIREKIEALRNSMELSEGLLSRGKMADSSYRLETKTKREAVKMLLWVLED